MSWFSDHELVGMEEEAPGEEIADGVLLERRRVLLASAAVTGTLLLGGAARATPGVRNGPDDLGLEELLARALPLSRKMVGDGTANEQAYLFEVAALVARLADKKQAPRPTMKAFRKQHQDPAEARFPLAVVQLRLKPGGRLPHHDHRNYNGIIVGVEGSVRIRNFDVVGANAVPPEGTTFQIRETQDTLVTPGQYSMLSRRRNNIHDLRAGPEGACVLDVFTFFDAKARSYWMEVDEEKPRDPEARIYDAAWKPRRRRQKR